VDGIKPVKTHSPYQPIEDDSERRGKVDALPRQKEAQMGRRAIWMDLPVVIDYSAGGGNILIEQVTPPTLADVDAYIKINTDEINDALLEDWRERKL
jgi:hypothetical protein